MGLKPPSCQSSREDENSASLASAAVNRCVAELAEHTIPREGANTARGYFRAVQMLTFYFLVPQCSILNEQSWMSKLKACELPIDFVT